MNESLDTPPAKERPRCGGPYVGLSVEERPSLGYLRKYNFVELDLRPPWPKPKTLRSWRSDFPSDFECSMVAPADIWRDTATSTQSLDWLTEALQALAAPIVVLSTKGEVSPGLRDRRRLDTLTQKLSPVARIVWEAGGAWDTETSKAQARRWGVLCSRSAETLASLTEPGDSVPPDSSTVTECTGGALAYTRLRSTGKLSDFGPSRSDQLASVIRQSGRTWYVSFRGPRGARDAGALQRAIKAPAF